MREKIAFSLIPVALVAGFFVGRLFPAHHYEPWKQTILLFDTATGRLCNPLKAAWQAAARAKANSPPVPVETPSTSQKEASNPFDDIAAGIDRTNPDT
ncbi:MAG: hypothetical protein WB799_24255, partial [Candidatus Sulfotelmatobacter sp.]